MQALYSFIQRLDQIFHTTFKNVFFSTYWSCLWQISLELMEVKLARHWDLKNAIPTCWDNGIYTQRTYTGQSKPRSLKYFQLKSPIHFSRSSLPDSGEWRYNCEAPGCIKVREIYYLILALTGWLKSNKLNMETKLTSAKFSVNRKPPFSISPFSPDWLYISSQS